MFAEKIILNDVFSDYLKIISERQLLNRNLWKNCVNVFSSGIDDADKGWRGEYWGKMMRGACLVYKVTRSDELFSVLTEAVYGLLSKQENSGRISAYSVENEFYGWDIWARKYVMTGLQHYLDICEDKELSSKIMTALTAHADYIINRIGDGKINILETGLYWGGINSASILEPFVRLYRDTKDKKHLAFAEYIISTGGCIDGDLLECVRDGKAPFEFPETKAYETMSFFEGLLAYYETTGKKEYLDTVIKFTDRLLETDYTAIGSCGCTHELFDNSTLRQTEPSKEIMQETCVTVTLMRLLARLFASTGNKKYIDALRKSALNALAGALNINGYEQFSNEKKTFLPGMVFDSYSPLCDGMRARGIGGFKQFADGSHFGCCACIASAGFALYPLMCVTQNGGEICVNYFADGDYTFLCGGKAVTVSVSESKIKITAPDGEKIKLKITAGDEYTDIITNKNAEKNNGYYVFENAADGDEFLLQKNDRLKEETINSKSSFNYGGYALAADSIKNPDSIPGKKIKFIRDENGGIVYKKEAPQAGEKIRFCAQTDCGSLLLTDYAAAGQDGKSYVTVWF